MSNVVSHRATAVAMPVLSLVVTGSLFTPWMRFGFGNMNASFTPITSDVASVGAWILVGTLIISTAVTYFKDSAIALVGWASASVAGFAILNWLVIQRFSSLFSIRVVKTEFGSVIQPALVIAMVASLLLVAVVVFDALGDVSASPLLQLTNGVRIAVALIGSIAILLSRDLPFVYARIGSVTWAVGGGSIPAIGEILGIAGLVCASCLIIGIFVSHVALERAVLVSAAIFGIAALIAALLDVAIISIISTMIGRLSGRPDGKAVIESAFGPWVCVIVSAAVGVSSIFAGRIGKSGSDALNDDVLPPSSSVPQI